MPLSAGSSLGTYAGWVLFSYRRNKHTVVSENASGLPPCAGHKAGRNGDLALVLWFSPWAWSPDSQVPKPSHCTEVSLYMPNTSLRSWDFFILINLLFSLACYWYGFGPHELSAVAGRTSSALIIPKYIYKITASVIYYLLGKTSNISYAN